MHTTYGSHRAEVIPKYDTSMTHPVPETVGPDPLRSVAEESLEKPR